jgi:hypothetical protein
MPGPSTWANKTPTHSARVEAAATPAVQAVPALGDPLPEVRIMKEQELVAAVRETAGTDTAEHTEQAVRDPGTEPVQH